MEAGDQAPRANSSHHAEAASFYRMARLTKRLYPHQPDVLERVDFLKTIGEYHAWLARIDEMTGRRSNS